MRPFPVLLSGDAGPLNGNVAPIFTSDSLTPGVSARAGAPAIDTASAATIMVSLNIAISLRRQFGRSTFFLERARFDFGRLVVPGGRQPAAAALDSALTRAFAISRNLCLSILPVEAEGRASSTINSVGRLYEVSW